MTLSGRLIGAHMSIAGGVENAVAHGKRVGCTAIQLFTKNNNQWNARPLLPENVQAFRRAIAETGVAVPLAHAAYLINLASPKPALWEQSFQAMNVEVDRAGVLEVPYLVLHPGSHVGTGLEGGIDRIANAINLIHNEQAHRHPMILLECMAGQGSTIGRTFEELRRILDQIRDQSRVGVCIDTCHLFAAGYDIRTADGFSKVLDECDRVIGLDRVQAFHLNDSKRELGSRVDRHEHIGKGQIGLAAFRYLLNDPRFVNIPMVLETPKGAGDSPLHDSKDEEDQFDLMNLRTLENLIAAPVLS